MIKVMLDKPDHEPEVMGAWDDENLDLAVATAAKWAEEQTMSMAEKDDDDDYEWSTLDGSHRMYIVIDEVTEPGAEETP